MTRRTADAFIRYVVAECPTSIVWDGDSYDEDSFTFLIPVELIAYLHEARRNEFRVSWAIVPAPFVSHEVADMLPDIYGKSRDVQRSYGESSGIVVLSF